MTPLQEECKDNNIQQQNYEPEMSTIRTIYVYQWLVDYQKMNWGEGYGVEDSGFVCARGFTFLV